MIKDKFIVINTPNKIKKIKIIGLIIERNESLILQDTLDEMAKIVDAIILFDDASEDNSLEIALKHPKVINVVINTKWESGINGERYSEESIHRQVILEIGKKYQPKWFLYQDADERIDGNIRKFMIENIKNKNIDGIQINLFDAYITSNDKDDYVKGMKLLNLRKYFGVERRNILMAFKNKKGVFFDTNVMARCPNGLSKIITKFHCQHYGKSLSIQHWEDTCDFYEKYFPIFSEKWANRRGKAIHKLSDFGTKLETWEKLKKTNGIFME